MKVKVCDALCGSGKTQSCIAMMNRQVENRFIFVTPYLEETERIKRDCASREFVTPKRSYLRNKSEDIQKLIREGRNIATTHSLFTNFTDETKELIRSQNYVLVLDEVLDIFREADVSNSDADLLMDTGILKNDGQTVWTRDDYSEGRYSDIKYLADSRNLVKYSDSLYFWSIPQDVFTCFKDFYILTYMFEYQFLKYCFEASGIEYELIGTKRVNGAFEFCPLGEMVRKRDLTSLIHIVENKKYNAVGKDKFSLSVAWFNQADEETFKQLKNNVFNLFYHKWEAKDGEKMWTTYIKFKGKLRGKGYMNSFVPFNMRATNEFSNRKYLVYCLNVFLIPWMRNYFLRAGVKKVNQDMYALSILIQWIFRSAIRNGEEVWIYIPSKRMRYLLTTWLENLKNGDDLKEIVYNCKASKKD
jgi:hypothetical protein